MKKIAKYVFPALSCVAIAFSVASFNNVNASTPAPVAGQPVDLTYAAEKALPSVVHIKYVQNSKVQTVDVQSDPFADFFDPFGGFFGRRHAEAPGADTKEGCHRLGRDYLGRRIHRDQQPRG